VSTIKSSAENLTLNADGSGNDIKFQSNGVEKASIDQDGNLVLSGTLTSVGIDDNANATAITIDSSEKVRIGNTTTFENGFNDLCVGSVSGTHGITIASENNATGTLAFADGDSSYGGHFQYNHSDNAFKFYTADTVRARIDSDGLKFNTDTAAANALDDYEEGTYSAVVTGATSGTFTMATERTLAYTKIGRLISIQGTIGVQSGSVSGNLRLSLPVAPTELTQDAEIGRPAVYLQNTGNTNSGQTFLQLSPDGSAYFTKISDGGSHSAITDSDVDSNFEIGVSFSYIGG
jgi:hypothetical protein